MDEFMFELDKKVNMGKYQIMILRKVNQFLLLEIY